MGTAASMPRWDVRYVHGISACAAAAGCVRVTRKITGQRTWRRRYDWYLGLPCSAAALPDRPLRASPHHGLQRSPSADMRCVSLLERCVIVERERSCVERRLAGARY